VNHPRILGIGTANPVVRLTQEQSFHAAGYQGERIRKIFLNSDIDHRHFYLEGTLNRGESSDQLNQRYLRGAMKTGCRAILNCLKAAGTTVQDVDLRELFLARVQYLIQQMGGGSDAVVTLLSLAKGLSCTFVAASHHWHGSWRKADCCRIEHRPATLHIPTRVTTGRSLVAGGTQRQAVYSKTMTHLR
jgi:hypothetical protein